MKYDVWWTIILDYRLHVLVDCWKENGDDECKCQGFVGNLLDDLSIYDVWHGSCISLSPKRHRAHAESIHWFIIVVGPFLESPACNAPKIRLRNGQGPHMRFSVPTRTYNLPSPFWHPGSMSELPHKGDSTYQAIKGPMDRSPDFPTNCRVGQAAKPLKWTKPGLCRRQRSPTILPYLPGFFSA